MMNCMAPNKIHFRIKDGVNVSMAIFIFADRSGHFRLSLIESKDSKDQTRYRRSTFYVDPAATNRTFVDRMAMDWSTDNDIKEAFSVERLSDEFFNEYKRIYQDFVEFATGKRMVKQGGKWVEVPTGPANTKIMDQFAQFGDEEMAEKAFRDYVKKMMGRLVFLQFLQKKGWLGVPEGGEWGDGDRNYLQNLFKHSDKKEDFLDSVLEPLFFDTLNTDRSKNGDVAADVLSIEPGKKIRIPYLNGGLFEKDALDETKVNFPAKFFARSSEKEKEGLLDIFDRFNFTIDENDEDSAEIGVDPEMLGRIFENLLEDNKDKGAFYTPREIVRYMCRESLIQYLGDTDENRKLVTDLDAEAIPPDRKKPLIEKLKAVKICDPAIGSGAFPMGMLNLLLKLRLRLGDVVESSERILAAKKEIIQNNLYGVDIDAGAVDIARLRFWLSVVVDETEPTPLPNFDYKIMQGNSLLEQFEGIDLSEITLDMKPERKAKDLTPDMFAVMTDDDLTPRAMKALMDYYYWIHDPKAKHEIRERLNRRIATILKKKAFDHPETVEKIDNIDWEQKPFFLWHTYFMDVFKEGGFDIVIGNPPYIRVQNMRHEDIDTYKKIYKSAWRRIDISLLFMELFPSFLKESGILCYISSNQFTTAEYGRKLRELLLKKKWISKIVDLGGLPVFESAITYVSIFLLSQRDKDSFLYHRIRKLPFVPPSDFMEQKFCDFNSEPWSFLPEAIREIQKKVEKQPLLSEIAFARGGIISGGDELYLFDKAAFPLERGVGLNIIRTENFGRYCTGEPGMTIFYPCFLGEDGDTKVMEMDVLKEKYPTAHAYILDNMKKIKARKDSRKTMGSRKHWYQPVRFGQLDVFRSPKILSPGIVNHNKFAVDEVGYAYSFGNIYSIVPKSSGTNIFVLTGILNSKLVEFYLHLIAPVKQGGYFSYNATVLEKIPCGYPCDKKIANRLEELVKKVMEQKKKDHDADTSVIEKQIDDLVYKLYGLTEEEIDIVEKSFEKEAEVVPVAAVAPQAENTEDEEDDNRS